MADTHAQCDVDIKSYFTCFFIFYITLYVCHTCTCTCTCTRTHMHMQCNERNKKTHEITLDVHITLYVCVWLTHAQCDVDIKSYFTCFFIFYITLYVCHTHTHTCTCTCTHMHMQCNERNKETHEITLDVHITLYVCVWLTHTYNVMWTSRVISHVSLFFTLHCTCVSVTHTHTCTCNVMREIKKHMK